MTLDLEILVYSEDPQNHQKDKIFAFDPFVFLGFSMPEMDPVLLKHRNRGLDHGFLINVSKSDICYPAYGVKRR